MIDLSFFQLFDRPKCSALLWYQCHGMTGLTALSGFNSLISIQRILFLDYRPGPSTSQRFVQIYLLYSLCSQSDYTHNWFFTDLLVFVFFKIVVAFCLVAIVEKSPNWLRREDLHKACLWCKLREFNCLSIDHVEKLVW